MQENPYQSPEVPPQKPSVQEGANALDAIIPTNPLAAIACYTGIFSVLFCIIGIILGPVAVLLGVLGLKKWNVQETAYGSTTSKIRAWIGVVTGIIGTIIGGIVAISIIAQMAGVGM